MKDLIQKTFVVIGVLVIFGPIIALVVGFPTMLLWNWLMPPIFGLPEISFLQAVGLFLLSNILIRNSSSVKSK
ncbi:MAG: hypothetical protein AABY22_19650 [Nanoarchaeota archaeon]